MKTMQFASDSNPVFALLQPLYLEEVHQLLTRGVWKNYVSDITFTTDGNYQFYQHDS